MYWREEWPDQYHVNSSCLHPRLNGPMAAWMIGEPCGQRAAVSCLVFCYLSTQISNVTAIYYIILQKFCYFYGLSLHIYGGIIGCGRTQEV